MASELAFSIGKDDLEWQYFRAGGNGGQKQNKTSSGARVIHHPSGARGESRGQRSQLQNRKMALRRMVATAAFKVWVNRQLASGPTPEEKVAQDMAAGNILVEVRVDGKWVAQ